MGNNQCAEKNISAVLFTEPVDDVISRIAAASRKTKSDTQCAHLIAALHRIEDSVAEVGAILAELKA